MLLGIRKNETSFHATLTPAITHLSVTYFVVFCEDVLKLGRLGNKKNKCP